MLCTDLKVAQNNLQYTFHNDNHSHYSKIDHFIINQEFTTTESLCNIKVGLHLCFTTYFD